MRAHRGAWSIAAMVAAGSLVLAGCTQAGPDDGLRVGQGEYRAVALADAVAADDVVAATWALGFAALRAAEADGDGSGAVVSPSSLVTALAMVAEGAVGDEAAPFDEALGAAGPRRTAAVAALQAALARYDGDPAVVQDDELPEVPMVHTAQRLVVDDDAEPQQEHLDRLVQGFDAGVAVADLGSSSSKKMLDAFVREHTGGLIERSALEPDPDAVAALQDAIVLAAAWQHPFVEAFTHDDEFTTAAGNVVQVPTMEGMHDVPAVEEDGWVAVRLSYTDDLAADLLLPPAAPYRPATSDAARGAALSRSLDTQSSEQVLVTLPRLDLTSRTDLMPLLTELGVADVSLSGIADTPVDLMQAAQQAVLRVDEAGTRAAAVTEVMAGEAAPVATREVRFDRPFLLVVRDVTTGWPLFLAFVADPTL